MIALGGHHFWLKFRDMTSQVFLDFTAIKFCVLLFCVSVSTVNNQCPTFINMSQQKWKKNTSKHNNIALIVSSAHSQIQLISSEDVTKDFEIRGVGFPPSTRLKALGIGGLCSLPTGTMQLHWIFTWSCRPIPV